MRSNSEGITPIVAARAIVAVAIGFIIAAGCQPARFDVVGHWQGRIPLPEGADVPQDLRNTTERVNLILHTGGKFEMVRLGLPIEGNYTVSGDRLSLEPTRVMNRRLSDLGPGMDQLGKKSSFALTGDKLVTKDLGTGETTFSRISAKP